MSRIASVLTETFPHVEISHNKIRQIFASRIRIIDNVKNAHKTRFKFSIVHGMFFFYIAHFINKEKKTR